MVLLEQHEGWLKVKRYTGMEALQSLDDPLLNQWKIIQRS